jgi:outer membrane lipoprotein-sorting protein
MKRRFAASPEVGLGVVTLFSVLLGSSAAAQNDLLARMAAINPKLHTFTATLHAHVAMQSFPYLSADLIGNYYYKEPDRNKVVFTGGVPVVASQFDKLYAQIESPSRWRDLYNVTVVSDDGNVTKFKLVPRKRGNVSHIDATAADKNATVTSMRWNYDNGGYAEMINHYEVINGNFVVQSQRGHVEEPGYVADITSQIDNYKLNPTLPDGLFAARN